MCKKVLIAAVAVVVALAVVKGTWLGSHIRLWRQNFQSAVRNRIPPEQEIQRLRMELDNLARDDDKHFDRVARQSVEVSKLERQVAQLKKELDAEEPKIRAMKSSLTGKEEEVSFNGGRYSRDALRTALRIKAQAFQATEERLHSKESELASKRQIYDLNLKKLSELKLVRQQMLTELQRLETALAEERHAQAREAATLDDAGYQKIRKDMDSIRDRIEFIKTKHQLKTQVNGSGSVQVDQERREKEAKIDSFIDNRFGEKADKQ